MTYTVGSNVTCPGDCWNNASSPAARAIVEAEEAAVAADVTVLAVGLGTEVEAEGLTGRI